MRRKTVLTIILIITSCLSLIMVVAFALLSTNFTVNFGNITKPSQTWNVFIQNTTYTANRGNGQTGTAGRFCPGGTASANGITLNGYMQLSKPNDYCAWGFTVKNTGTIDAKISSITATSLTAGGGSVAACTYTGSTYEVTCGPLVYYISTDSAGQNKLTTNTVVSKNSQASYYMIAKNTSSSIREEGDGDLQITQQPTIRITFAQY